jgi:hypothetical protein
LGRGTVQNYWDYLIENGPEGSTGSANMSGWMTGYDILLFMEHFVKHPRITNDRPVLPLLDKHQSHLAVKVFDLAKEIFIVLLSFPPHTSHKLQPLDRSVFSPFKNVVNNASEAWLRSDPGRTMTICDFPSIASQSLPNALTPKNIKSW